MSNGSMNPTSHLHLQLSTLIVLLTALAGCLAPTVPLPAPPSRDAIKPTVAVTLFENRSGFPGQWELGPGMADLLLAELVKSRHFVLVDRHGLDALVAEIDNQGTEYFRHEGKVVFGRLKNVSYFIRGVITDFTQTSNATLRGRGNHFGAGLWGHTARVALTLTVVEVESGQIIASVNVAQYAPAGGIYAAADYKDIHFGGDAFFRTPLGIATQNAIRKGIHNVVKTIPKDKWHARIAAIESNRIIITGGIQSAQKNGMLFDVLAPDQIVRDPITGDVIDMLPGQPLGQLRVIQSRNKTSITTRVSGTGFEVGQRIRLIRKETASSSSAYVPPKN